MHDALTTLVVVVIVIVVVIVGGARRRGAKVRAVSARRAHARADARTLRSRLSRFEIPSFVLVGGVVCVYR